jgi:hypothetical protein
VAVTVGEHSVVVLDEDGRVVEAMPSAGGLLRAGSCPLEELPNARACFAPYLERAKRTGVAAEFVEFVYGRVVQVTVEPDGTRLVVSWRTLEILDVLTLDGLRDSLHRVVRTLDEAEARLRRSEVRRSLRVLDGGT